MLKYLRVSITFSSARNYKVKDMEVWQGQGTKAKKKTDNVES